MNKFLLLVCLLTQLVSSKSAFEVKLLVPLYMEPNEPDFEKSWQTIANASARIPIISVVNSTNDQLDDVNNYKSVLTKLKQTNTNTSTCRLLGYVASNFGNRSASEVKTAIERYSMWPDDYRVEGIFIDEISVSVSEDKNQSLIYYQDIYNYTKSVFVGNRSKLIANSFQAHSFDSSNHLCTVYSDDKCVGTRAADIVVVFDNSFESWLNFSITFDFNSAPVAELAALVRNCSSTDDMKRAIDKAIELKIGHVYVTDRPDWTHLATYFDDQIDYIASKSNSYVSLTNNSQIEESFNQLETNTTSFGLVIDTTRSIPDESTTMTANATAVPEEPLVETTTEEMLVVDQLQTTSETNSVTTRLSIVVIQPKPVVAQPQVQSVIMSNWPVVTVSAVAFCLAVVLIVFAFVESRKARLIFEDDSEIRKKRKATSGCDEGVAMRNIRGGEDILRGDHHSIEKKSMLH